MEFNNVLMLSGVQSLDVISVNIWQILISLANLTILFLLLKKFLYKPVLKVLSERQAAVEAQYADAEKARADALADKAEYADKLAKAEITADEMRKSAADEARHHGEKIIAEAKAKADGIVRQAEAEIELEKNKAAADMKREIADVSARLAEKLIGREIDENAHRSLIDGFIDEIGTEK